MSDLSGWQRRMCAGPHEAEPVDGFDRAEVAASASLVQGMADWRLKHLLALSQSAPAQSWSAYRRGVVQSVRPAYSSSGCRHEHHPSVMSRRLPPDVQWYEGKNISAELCSVPQVTKEFRDDASVAGTLYLVEEILATPAWSHISSMLSGGRCCP